MTRYSETHSRCGCGHRLIRNEDGTWRHINPHPDHVCSCKDPQPAENIGLHRTSKPQPANCGICEGLLMAHYGRDDLA